MRVPDLFEPIIAWRVFQIGERGLLYGINVTMMVEPMQPMRAHCFRVGSIAHFVNADAEFVGAPARYCVCGVYAFKNKKDAAGYRPQRSGLSFFGWDNETTVVCTVKLWGRVIEHETGYRAEFAYPERFYLDSKSQKFSNQLTSLYGVPCVTYGEDYNPPDEIDHYLFQRLSKLHRPTWISTRPRQLGVITGITGPFPSPIQAPPPPVIHHVPPKVVGANRHQTKLYTGLAIPRIYHGITIKQPTLEESKTILREMVYKKV